MVTAIIIPDIVVETQPTNVNECVGGQDQMTVAISGGSGLISYQWQSSTDGNDPWANAVGTGCNNEYIYPTKCNTWNDILQGTGECNRQQIAQQAVSSVVTAIIIPDIVVETQPTNVNECVGGLDQMTVAISGGSGLISYQWQSSTRWQ